MPDDPHIVNTEWRNAEALGLELRAQSIEEWLAHTEDLVEMFGEDKPITSALRRVAGLMRSQRDDFTSSAGKLRA